jgi:hypothetical protein
VVSLIDSIAFPLRSQNAVARCSASSRTDCMDKTRGALNEHPIGWIARGARIDVHRLALVNGALKTRLTARSWLYRRCDCAPSDRQSRDRESRHFLWVIVVPPAEGSSTNLTREAMAALFTGYATEFNLGGCDLPEAAVCFAIVDHLDFFALFRAVAVGVLECFGFLCPADDQPMVR